MSNKVLVDGVGYDIIAGTARINATTYDVSSGKTLINYTAYNIPIGYEWVGWDNATWEDINNLCIAKRRGIIREWPNDVQVGNLKQVNLKSTILGTRNHKVRLIGIDQDADGSLTFCTQGTLVNQTKFKEPEYRQDGVNYGTNYWHISLVRNLCSQYYNALPMKDMVLPVKKGTCRAFIPGAPDNAVYYTTEYVFLPSDIEMGTDVGYESGGVTFQTFGPIRRKYASITHCECTQGKMFTYQYFENVENRKVPRIIDTDGNITYTPAYGTYSNDAYWLRSRGTNRAMSDTEADERMCLEIDKSNGQNLSVNGFVGNGTDHVHHGLLPTFVIGNESAITF